MRIAGFALSLAAVGVTVVLSSGVQSFVDLPALLFVLLFGVGIVVATHGLPATRHVWRSLFGQMSPEHSAEVRQIAATGRHGFVAAGWVGVIIGVVQMLSSLDDPANLGKGTAVALLSALYGYLLAYLVCLPVERRA